MKCTPPESGLTRSAPLLRPPPPPPHGCATTIYGTPSGLGVLGCASGAPPRPPRPRRPQLAPGATARPPTAGTRRGLEPGIACASLLRHRTADRPGEPRRLQEV